MSQVDQKHIEHAIVGIGCYWGTEHYYRTKFADAFPGSIIDVKVGFMGGNKVNPTYRQVCESTTGHAEVAKITFDNTKADYTDLIRFAFALHDPTTYNRQGNDQGSQYQSVIFYENEIQKNKANQVKKFVQNLLDNNKLPYLKSLYTWENKQIVTNILPAQTFYPAHDDHQLYLENNPNGYCNHKVRLDWTSTSYPSTKEINDSLE